MSKMSPDFPSFPPSASQSASQICLYYFRGFPGLDQSLQEVAFGVSDFGRGYSKTGHTLPVENMHLCIKPVPLPKK